MLYALLFFACQNDTPKQPLVAQTQPISDNIGKETVDPNEPDMPLIVVAGRIHPSCEGIAMMDVLPLEGVDPVPLMTESVASDGSFSIEIPKLTPVALHSSCYNTAIDIENDEASWRVHPLSLKPLSEPVTNLVLFQEGLRPDHSPVEGVTLEEAIEISQIRRAASLPEIIGPTPPSERDKETIIQTEFFEQGPPIPGVNVQVDPSNNEPIRHAGNAFQESQELGPSGVKCELQDDFWTMFYGIEPDKDIYQNCPENEYRPLGTSAAKTNTSIRKSDLRRYYESLIAMITSHSKAMGVNPNLMLPEPALIQDCIEKGSLYTPEYRYLSQRFRQACEILKIHCPPPTLIVQQRFVLNDKRSVQQSDQGAALSAYLWVKSEQLIREAQSQGVDPRPYLPDINELIEASNDDPQSQSVKKILMRLKSGYSELNLPFQTID